MTESILTQSRLKELLHYCPDSGVFTWLESTARKISIGDTAGTLNSGGYSIIAINTVRHRAHRLAFLYMDGSLPEYHVDHIDGVRDNNCWVNLRSATKLENSRNIKKRIDNTSGVLGVSWHKAARKWSAYIHINKKRKHIGLFVNLSDAVAARKAADIEHGYHSNHGR